MSEHSEYFLASSPDVVQLDCVEVAHPDFSQTYRIVRNKADGVIVTQGVDEFSGWVFDGVDDVIAMGDVLDFETSDEFSVTGWATTTGAAIITKQLNAGAPGWRLASALSGASTGFGFAILGTSGDGVYVDCALDFTDNLEHFIASTYDGSGVSAGVELYADGAPKSTNVVFAGPTVGSSLNTTDLQIGKRGASTSRSGMLRHVAVWNRVLTESELDEVYNGGDPPDLTTVSCTSALVGWWKLDDVDTSDPDGVIDYGPDGLDGTANFEPTIITEGEIAYDYYPLQVMPIASQDDLVQALSVTLGDVGDVIADEIENVWEANGNDTRPTLTYRQYRSDDLSAPIYGPVELEIVNVTTTREGASFEARAPETNASRTGELYTVERFPMLAGFT